MGEARNHTAGRGSPRRPSHASLPSTAYDCLLEMFGLDIVERALATLSEYAGGEPFGHLNYLVRAQV